MKTYLKYLITFAIGLVIVLIIICSKGIFEQSRTQVIMQILSDALFVSGVCITGVGVISFASKGGAFDMLAYGVRVFFIALKDAFSREKIERKYKDFYEYSQAKKGRESHIGFILIVGLIFIAVSVVFLIIYNNLG